MPKPQATAEERKLLLALAAEPGTATATRKAVYDLMAHDLRIADVCDALWRWIVDEHAVSRTTMHGEDAGEPAFEIWPDLAGRKFYCKFLIRGNPLLRQTLFVVSSHPDDPHSPTRGRPS